MSSKEEYMFHAISLLESKRGMLAIDKNGVVILQTKDLHTDKTVDVCLAGTLEELSGFVEALERLVIDLNNSLISEPEEMTLDNAVPPKKIIH